MRPIIISVSVKEEIRFDAKFSVLTLLCLIFPYFKRRSIKKTCCRATCFSYRRMLSKLGSLLSLKGYSFSKPSVECISSLIWKGSLSFLGGVLDHPNNLHSKWVSFSLLCALNTDVVDVLNYRMGCIQLRVDVLNYRMSCIQLRVRITYSRMVTFFAIIYMK